jgi:hypothetical protein
MFTAYGPGPSLWEPVLPPPQALRLTAELAWVDELPWPGIFELFPESLEALNDALLRRRPIIIIVKGAQDRRD